MDDSIEVPKVYLKHIHQGLAKDFIKKVNKEFRLHHFFNKPEKFELFFKKYRELINLNTKMSAITAQVDDWLNFIEKYYPEIPLDKIPLSAFTFDNTVRNLVNILTEIKIDTEG